MREGLGTLGNILEGKLFRFAYTLMFGKQQPKCFCLETDDINPSLKPLGTIKARLAKPKRFHLKSQPVEDAKPKRVTHKVRRCCIYFFPCSQQVQQQIWADEHQQT